MIVVEPGEQIESVDDLCPNSAIRIGVGIAIEIVSTVSPPGPIAIASVMLGVSLNSYTNNCPE
jgi:hypothetical protein